jgi:HEAT repeat protein
MSSRRLFSSAVAVLWLLLPLRAAAQTSGERAWSLIQEGVNDKNARKRAQAVLALGFFPEDEAARRLAEVALIDHQADVRSAAAHALARMGAESSIPLLRRALDDQDPKVVISAADALFAMHDSSAYRIFEGILAGSRKSGDGLIESYERLVKNPRAMLQMGIEHGIGFVPYGMMAYDAFRAITEDTSSPVRAEAAGKLAYDNDRESAEILCRAARDKRWRVREAAAAAIAVRSDPALSDALIPLLGDRHGEVRFTAAAAIVRLSRPRTTKAAHGVTDERLWMFRPP